MSKEEFLKIQKCVLKVNIHCDGCRQKVKKILQKIDGVFTTQIDAEQGKVTVSGNVDPNLLIKKLAKSGKHAELWGAAPKPNNNHHNNQNHLGNANQVKNMQIEQLKGMGNDNQNNKGQNPKGGGGNNQPKGGGGGQQQGPNPQQQLQLQHLQQLQQQQRLQQQLQQLQQMKGFQDLNIPQFKDLKLPPHNPNPKAVKFDIPEDDEDFTDDELDDFEDDDEFDEEFDDDDVMDELPPNKMKLPPTMMNVPKAANNVAVTANIGKKGAGPGPFQVHGGGQKGGGGGGGHNPGGCNKSGNNGGKNGGGTLEGKNGGGGIKNNNGVGGNINNNMNMNGGKKGNPMGGVGVQPPMNAGFRNIGGGGGPHAMSGSNMGPMNMSMPSMPPVQGLPAASMNGGGYFQGGGPNGMAGNPFQQQQQQQLQHQQQLQQQLQHQQQLQQQQLQQQYMGAMMGNERFQPMMYARPPPAVNYMYPPYPYPPPDPYTHFFSDENTSSCNVM
ncbi:hypothetical protein PHAVU_003G092500 [Phaseolus vulgaris]|uniref:HMA domain-containing protein n=1 Tax=Phaseolus vulgaris TaxID=3885 RepID=V7CA11_PHAVU|nr:hypothetical protein PHAVU_003G092500g [Phaseolus vulgaris]ESW26120.1 hypothetical protein PHAVU_003G092500g [Phaseolus vulgaris]